MTQVRVSRRHVSILLVVGALFVATAASFARASQTSDSAALTSCRAQVRHDVLPTWMRGGFSDPKPRVPYAVGDKGVIGAVIFGWPLKSPSAQDRNNKILWVPHHYPTKMVPFWIRLQLMDGDKAIGAPTRKIIPTGPGPSIVDVPTAGCWRLTFTWAGRRDTLDLDYTPPN